MPNGRRERCAPACAAPDGLQQAPKVLLAPAQQNPWPAQKLRLEVAERRSSEAGDEKDMEMAGARVQGRCARRTLVQRQLRQLSATPAT